MWSYGAHIGIEEGLRAAGVRWSTVTTPWLKHVGIDLCAGRYDQVWVNDLVHLDVDRAFWERLVELAPVRVGFLVESVHYTESELQCCPSFRGRAAKLRSLLPFLTHVVACDERDAEELPSLGSVYCMWSPFAVPKRYITASPPMPSLRAAAFCGTPYDARRAWLLSPSLDGLLVRQSPLEDRTQYPRAFNALHKLQVWLPRWAPRPLCLACYMAALRSVRRNCYRLWLRSLQSASLVVNLPHFVKTYTTRVVEGMAAGRPVVSWEIPDRPRNRALFEDGEEIALYGADDPRSLADQIRRLLGDPALAMRIVRRARAKLGHYHTVETRVRQILDWLETGSPPAFG